MLGSGRAGHDRNFAQRNPTTLSRRGLQISLGALWLLDGCLQLQPYMFTPGFATDVIGSAGDGQAGFVSRTASWAASLISAHPLLWNLPFALIQLAIGFGLLWQRTSKRALIASIAWALSVWYLGEGLGGITGHTAWLLTGAPGAALLYAVIAAAAWPADENHTGTGADLDLPRRWLPIAWMTYWVGGAILQLVNGPTRGADLAADLAGSANNAPGWLSRVDFSLARTANHLSHTQILLLIGAQALIGLAALTPPPARTCALVIGACIAVGYWLVGQEFGQLVTGRATDPNTGPLVVLLAIATGSVTTASHRTPTTKSRARRTELPQPTTSGPDRDRIS